MDLQATTDALRTLVDNVEKVITGKRSVVELAAVALFADQHLLIDDVPGVGKTMLARAIALSIDGTFKRVQGTPDLLPGDITGSTVYDHQSGSFHFVQGPVFTNVLLFDEINRATPKTQSALLEVMEERSVSVDGDVHHVPQPFFVVATRNPIEHHGTFPLPEGELDRFGISTGLGYPDLIAEKKVIMAQMDHHPINELDAVLNASSVEIHRGAVRTVHIDPSIIDYLLEIVSATRSHPDISLGASPRGSLALTRTAQSLAVLRGRDHVLPDDVKAVASAALAHRLILNSGTASRTAGVAIIDSILSTVAAPVGVAPR